MIHSLQKISEVLGAATKGRSTTYNASLPMLIRVLAQLKGDTYLLQVGTQQIQSRSQKELIVGQRYWGEMSKSSLGQITLCNLTPQPKIIESFHNAPLKFSLQDLYALGERGDVLESVSDFVAHKLTQAQSREEFLFLSNLLLGTKDGILSFVIGEKEDILQCKKVAKNKIRFSAIMPSLGIIEGEIGVFQEGNTLVLKVMYESTKEILQKNLSELKGFKVGHISVDIHLKPLLEFSQALLDVRG